LVARTWEQTFTTSSTQFVDVPSAGLNIVVPAGSDCIMVNFSGVISGGSLSSCMLRATINGTPMSPGDAAGRFVGIGNVANHSWAQQVTPASQTTYLVRIQLKANSSDCSVSQWELVVDRRE
jgi:hypothetical protein